MNGAMDLLPSPEQTQVLDAICGFLAAEAPVERLRKHGATGNPDARLWRALGDLGYVGIALDERDGGIGLGSAEEMLAFREYGRNLVSPGILALTLAARIAARTDETSLRDQFLAGDVPVGLANGRADVEIGRTVSGDFHLFEATAAPWILFVSDVGAGLFAREQFADIQTVAGTDAVLTLERARLNQTRPRLWLDSGSEPIEQRAVLLIAAYAVGLGEATRDMAVSYAKIREQFGKPIGSFQAIKHICASMAVRSEAALCQTSFASLAFQQDHADKEFHVVSSKIVAVDAALRNAADNIQVHGAFGFTVEADAHHYLKRSHVVDLLWGDLKAQRERLLALPSPQ
jgi:alkylation response protein AidB-like acyl-CoA dehydrogenase